MRSVLVLIAFGLGAIWVMSLVLGTGGWLAWLDGVGAFATLAVAWSLPADPGTRGGLRALICGLVAIGLASFGFIFDSPGWTVAATFGCAAAFFLVAYFGAITGQTAERGRELETR